MRFEDQPWNAITARLEVISAGVGVTGLSPTAQIKRLSDGKYWNGATWQVGATSVSMAEVDATNEPGVYEAVVLTAQLDYALGTAGYRFWVKETTNLVLQNGFILQQHKVSWDEARSGYTVAGTFGEGVGVVEVGTGAIDTASFAAGAIDAAAIAADAIGASELATDAVAEITDAVWDELVSGHVASGSFGHRVAMALGIGGQFWHRIKSPTYDAEGRLLTAQLVAYPTSADADADANEIGHVDVTATYDVDGNLATFKAV